MLFAYKLDVCYRVCGSICLDPNHPYVLATRNVKHFICRVLSKLRCRKLPSRLRVVKNHAQRVNATAYLAADSPQFVHDRLGESRGQVVDPLVDVCKFLVVFQ